MFLKFSPLAACVARQCQTSDQFTDLVFVCEDGRLSVHRFVTPLGILWYPGDYIQFYNRTFSVEAGSRKDTVIKERLGIISREYHGEVQYTSCGVVDP